MQRIRSVNAEKPGRGYLRSRTEFSCTLNPSPNHGRLLRQVLRPGFIGVSASPWELTRALLLPNATPVCVGELSKKPVRCAFTAECTAEIEIGVTSWNSTIQTTAHFPAEVFLFWQNKTNKQTNKQKTCKEGTKAGWASQQQQLLVWFVWCVCAGLANRYPPMQGTMA